MRTTKLFALLPLALTAMVHIATAQEPNATLVGRVTDRAHAAIIEATIQVRNVDTNAVRTGKSGPEGEYTISNLPPGWYEVTVDKQGFKQLHEARLELSAAQTARLDAQLEVGAVSETIDVNAETPLINSETSSRGDVVAPKEIAEIPLNGRDFNDLAFTVPGVSPQEQGGKGSKYVVNGARADASNIIIDGFNDESARDAGAQVSPPLDSLQEFKFQTSGYSAEYGRLAGGVTNMALKSGGNQIHGSIFEYLRNDMFDAKNHFALLGKNKLRQNQFGGTLTGPVVIPGLYNGHDRTFFMVSWESQRRISNTPTPTLVPTALERMGDFSQTVDAQGNPVKLKSPFNFANSKIPAQRINPVSQALLKYYPSPNFSSSLIPGKNYLSTISNTDNYDAFVFKVDQRLDDKDNLGARVIYRPSNQFNPLSGSDTGFFGSTTDHNDAIYGISETRVFTPNLINEFHAVLTRSTNSQSSRDVGTNWPAQLGIQGAPTTTNPAFLVFPNIAVTNYATLGDSKTNPVTFTLNAYDLTDGVTWNKGKHSLKIGGELLRVGYFQQTHDQLNGSFSFKKTFSGVPFADFLLGLPDTATVKTAAPTSHIYSPYYAVYFQDDYKVFPKLTLNLGLRYEVAVAPHERNGEFSNFVPGTGKVIIGSAAAVPNLNTVLAQAGATGKVGLASDFGLPSSTIRTYYKGISPRFGFAWRPFNNNGTVVRGGYGIFFTGSRLSAIRTDIAGGFPFAITRQWTGIANPKPTDPPLNKQTIDNALVLAQLQGLTTATGYDVNAPEPYLQSYNLTIERSLGKGVAIEVGYTGSKGSHLGRKYNINQQLRDQFRQLADRTTGKCPNCPRLVTNSFGNIDFYSWGATSNYNAGIVTVRKQFGRGPLFRINYTYGKSLDENSGLNYAGDGGFKAVAQDSQHLRSEYGCSDFDIRHTFSTSVIYPLPFTSHFLIRDWQLSGTATAYSGQPFTPVLNGNKQDAGEPTRPDRVGNGALSNPTQRRWFDLSAFQDVPLTLFRFGNSGRNILDGPRKMQINLALARNFSITEHSRLQFRWEAFNLTNHTNLQLPNADVTPGNQSAGTITKADDGRVMQVALSFRF